MTSALVTSLCQYGLCELTRTQIALSIGTVVGTPCLPSIIGKINTVWAASDVIQGRNIELHSSDAPQTLRTLYERLLDAEKKTDQSRSLIERALADFFSTPGYESCIKCYLTSLEFRREPFLNPLRRLYDAAPTDSKEDLQAKLETCLTIVKDQVARQQGIITKVKESAKGLIVSGSSSLISGMKTNFHPGQGSDHPLVKIRHLLTQKQTSTRDKLLSFQFSKLGKADLKIEDLDTFLSGELLRILGYDRPGLTKICEKFEIEIEECFRQNPKMIDQVYIAYKLMREAEPRMPPPPPELVWNDPTLLNTEKAKTLDLISSFGVLIFFKQVYGGDEETLHKFYECLADAQFLDPKERKKKIFGFFESERDRIGGSWIPWIAQKQVLDFIYCTVKRSVFNFCSETPLFTTIGEQFKTAPTASLTFFGDKLARYFHALKEDHAEWASQHAAEMKAEPYLQEKLYLRQDEAVGRLNIDTIVSKYNLVSIINGLSSSLAKWSESPTFNQAGRFSSLNSPIMTTKNLLTIVPRIIFSIIQIPLQLLEKLLDSIYQKTVEQVLIHTSILDHIDEVVTDALLSISPAHFPLLEIVLSYLHKISTIIDTESLKPEDYPEGSDQAKRALEDGVRQLVAFTKTQDSTSQDDQSHEKAIFETTLPFAIDKIYDSYIKVHKVYSQQDDASKQQSDVFQAFNFVAYNNIDSFSGEETANLEERFTEVKTQIAFYLQKILTSLLVQTSKEEISPEVGEMVQSLLTQVKSGEHSPLMHHFSQRKKALFLDLLQKPYITKGLLLFLITRDKESSTED